MRWKNPELDTIIEQIQRLDFDDPKVLDAGPASSSSWPLPGAADHPDHVLQRVHRVCDETYWTGFPDAEHPYTDPVPNWANTKYMFVKIQPKA